MQRLDSEANTVRERTNIEDNVMASISSDPNGRKRIQFINCNGERQVVRLGKMSIKDAEAIRTRIEALVAASVANTPVDRQTATWLADICDTDWYRHGTA